MSIAGKSLGRWLGLGRADRLPDLGERELAVLEVLWAKGAQSSQAVQALMPGEPISLSTIQSTLERLFRKKLVSRSKAGRAYQYRASISRSQLIGGLLRDMAEDVAGGQLAPMLSGFLQYVAAEDPELGPRLSRALADDDPAPGSWSLERGDD